MRHHTGTDTVRNREHYAAHIVLDGPGHEGTRLQLREGITSFGRLPANDVILLGDLVSRQHARITYFEGRATLQDLGSHNGSWVNGERVTTRVLRNGDLARIGNFRLTFHRGPIGVAPESFDDVTKGEARRVVRSSEGSGEHRAISAKITDLKLHQPKTPDLPEGYRSVAESRSELVSEIQRVQSGGKDLTTRALHLVYRASEALGSATSVDGYLREILNLVFEEIPTDQAAIIRTAGPESPTVIAHRSRKRELDETPISMEVVRWVTMKNFPVKTDDVTEDLRFPAEEDLKNHASVLCVPISEGQKVLHVIYLSRTKPAFQDHDLDALSAIAHLSTFGIERAENRSDALAREVLSRFQSPDVVELILNRTRNTPSPGTELEGKTATISSSDIQGFASLCRRLKPEEVSGFLHVYLDRMSEIIFDHRGTIDRFDGAGIQATYGVPFSYGNDAAKAVGAALEMRDAFDDIKKRFPKIGPMRLRVGIDTGWVLAGIIGSDRRLQYGTLGTPPATARRLEASAAPGVILIGESTRILVQELYGLKKLELQQMRSHYQPLQVYEVLGRKTNAASNR